MKAIRCGGPIEAAGGRADTWSELPCSPLAWRRFDLAAQPTDAYERDFDIQRGLRVGFSCNGRDLTTYIVTFGSTDPTVVVATKVSF